MDGLHGASEDHCVHFLQVRTSGPPGSPPQSEDFEVWIVHRRLCRFCCAAADGVPKKVAGSLLRGKPNPSAALHPTHSATIPGSGYATRSDSQAAVAQQFGSRGACCESSPAGSEEDFVATPLRRGAPASWRKKERPRLARSSSTPGQTRSISSAERAGLEKKLRVRRHRARRLAEDDCGLELAMLSRQSDIDLEEVQELKHVFDSFDKTRSGLLNKAGFSALVRAAFLLDKKEEVPEELLDGRWFELQSMENPIATIDFDGFLLWYQANRFVEQLLITKSLRLVRDLARRHDLQFANVERIYRVFADFDVNFSGMIELPEFRALVSALLCTGKEAEISEVMFHHLWTEASQDAQSIDFETFLLWYSRHFGEDQRSGQGASLLREYYRSLRIVPMLPANAAELF